MRKLIAAGVLAVIAAAAAAPASAKSMNCSLDSTYGPALLKMSPFSYKGATYQLVQTKTFSGAPGEVGEQDSHISVQWTVTLATQLLVPVQARTRSPSDCLVAIADSDKKKWWSGMSCDDSAYKNTGTHYVLSRVSDASVTATPQTPVVFAMGGGVSTVNNLRQFMGFYAQTGSAASYKLIGACVEG
jgi:hypothetical protein